MYFLYKFPLGVEKKNKDTWFYDIRVPSLYTHNIQFKTKNIHEYLWIDLNIIYFLSIKSTFNHVYVR